jgi:molybdopterin-containing oxidoreductase family iron-sulfur binding subunit
MSEHVRPHGTPEQTGHSAHAGPGFIPLETVGKASAELDLEQLRRRAQSGDAPRFWRSLDELGDTEAFRAQVGQEFPGTAPRDMLPLNRRDFVRVMGATMALAGVAGCAYQPPERIVPYIENPEQLVPGKPLYYSTAFPERGYAQPVLAEAQMGRPVKLEGNPDHGASLGATNTATQASVLELYDPDRSQSARFQGQPTTWDAFADSLFAKLTEFRAGRGAGLRVLTGAVTSPTLAHQLQTLLKLYPEARVHYHEPVSRNAVHAGLKLAFGVPAQPVYHIDRAQRILSLDGDFLIAEPGSVRYARDFAAGRKVDGKAGGHGQAAAHGEGAAHGEPAGQAERRKMKRLYVIESTPTLTGANADHRRLVKPSEVEGLARQLATALGVSGVAEGAPAGADRWIDAVVVDLKEHRGTSLVVAGAHQPAAVHALTAALNEALGNQGQTVTYTEPLEAHFDDPAESLAVLTRDMEAGKVKTLLILGGNPVYTAPADVDFKTALAKVPLRVHAGLHDDETGMQCDWHVPLSHYLETWSDARAYDGSACIIQPLIEPLVGSHSAHEILALFLGQGDRPGYEIVRDYWEFDGNPPMPPNVAGAGLPVRAASMKRTAPSAAFEARWHQALSRGTIPGAAARPVDLPVRALSIPSRPRQVEGASMELLLLPCPSVGDGSSANNPWLQELPRPFTSLSWDNAALINPVTARNNQLQPGDFVEISAGQMKLKVAVWPLPAQPEGVITLHLGYGREHAGKVGNGVGFNAYRLRSNSSPHFSPASIAKVRGRHDFAQSQRYFNQLGRQIIRTGDLDEYLRNHEHAAFMHREEGGETTLFPRSQKWPSDKESSDEGGGSEKQPDRWSGEGYGGNPIPAWGMVIDLGACIGCSACTVACQAENNIATVGKDQVMMHRDMAWIRIDQYHEGDPAHPDRTLFQPLPCMHCENAPCEPVCPVGATTHSAEGINEMVYNRCVGTRYCQNNCPYKVRRFNYLQYSDQQTPLIKLLNNPDVTVRSRGVMEKCTFCIQRINQARIEAEKEERPIRDGEVVTACQQVCPAQAITFGNLNDNIANGRRGSKVRQLREHPLNYGLLEELNVRPRTTYLAKLWNPNPRLGGGAAASSEEH